MQIEITAIIERVCKVQTFDNSTFTKRDLILNLDPNGKYENVIAVTYVKDKTSLLDSFKKGDKVTVTAYVQGRSYLKPGTSESNRKYFNELRGTTVKSHEIVAEKDETTSGKMFEPEIDDDSADLPF